MTNPTGDLDDVVHQGHRLGVLTIAAEADQVEFTYLRDTVNLTAGNLSKHLSVLEDAHLVSITKGYHGRRPKTWITIATAGRTALGKEIAALNEVVRRHQQATPPKTPVYETKPRIRRPTST